MTDIEKVLYLADTQNNVTESPPNTNKGLKVEEYLGIVGLPAGQPWCAAFVAWVGRTALGAKWPLPMTGGVVALHEAAKKKGMVKDAPQPGDIFVLWFPKMNRFAHTGFVVSAAPGDPGAWATIEGNTSGAGSREGWGCFRRKRTFAAADKFIRWSA